MGISVSARKNQDYQSRIDVTIDVAGWTSGTRTFYISVRNENSQYRDYNSLYVSASPSVVINGEGRISTYVESGYLSNNTRWYVSVRSGGETSNESGVTMLFEGSIPADFVISERPTQQTQKVYYNGIYMGEAGSCVANALVSVKHVQELRNGKDILDYSVAWLYGMAGDGTTEQLMYDNTLNLLKQKGVPPYQVVNNSVGIIGYPDIALQRDAKNIYNQNNSVEINNFALPQKIGSWKAVGRYSDDMGFYNQVIDAIKSKTVMMVINIDESLDNTTSTGIVGGIVGRHRGGHAMLLLGVRTIDNKKYWIAQNSWGAYSGDSGLYYIPFSWFTFGYGGICGFYIIEDDPSAPPLPPVPDLVDVPAISMRREQSLRLYVKQNPLATNYQLRYRRNGTSTYSYVYHNEISYNKVYFEIAGLTSGTTYELSARMYKSGTWSGWSNVSLGTTTPWKPKIITQHINSSNSIIVRASLYNDYDGGGYTGVTMRLMDWETNVRVTEVDCQFNQDCVISGLSSGRKYYLEPYTYLNVNGGTVINYGNSIYFTFINMQKPTAFSWDRPKIKGQPFNITKDEWNRFVDHTYNMCVYHLLTTYRKTYVNTGDKPMGGSSGNMWYVVLHTNNAMDYKYKDSTHRFDLPSRGTQIKADWLNNMVSELNSML